MTTPRSTSDTPLCSESGGTAASRSALRFFMTSILTSQALTITCTARTALHIGERRGLLCRLRLRSIPTAGGRIHCWHNQVVADTRHWLTQLPRSQPNVRRGTAQLSFSRDVRLAGEFYAASSAARGLVSEQQGSAGSVFAGNFKSSQVTDIHYDRAVLRAGDECPPGGTGDMRSGAGGRLEQWWRQCGGTTGCGSCADCHNQACNNLVCGACTTDADCCAPLSLRRREPASRRSSRKIAAPTTRHHHLGCPSLFSSLSSSTVTFLAIAFLGAAGGRWDLGTVARALESGAREQATVCGQAGSQNARETLTQDGRRVA